MARAEQRVRDEQLRLEELELAHKCCICETTNKTKRCSEHDWDRLTLYFGKTVRGFMCEVCLSIAGLGDASAGAGPRNDGAPRTTSSNPPTRPNEVTSPLPIELKNAAASVFCQKCTERRSTVVNLDTQMLMCSQCGDDTCKSLGGKFATSDHLAVQKAIKGKKKAATATTAPAPVQTAPAPVPVVAPAPVPASTPAPPAPEPKKNTNDLDNLFQTVDAFAPAPAGFGGPAPTSGFGGPAPAAGGDIFGGGFGGPAPTSGFGAPTSGFGGPAPVSGFGGPAPTSGFGGPAPTSGFGGPAPNSGFGGPAPNSGFGGPTSGFGGPAPTSGFGAPSTGFGGPAPNSGFGGPAPNSGFGGPAPNSGFGGPTSGFGAPAPATGGDFFGGAPTSGFGGPSTFGGPTAPTAAPGSGGVGGYPSLEAIERDPNLTPMQKATLSQQWVKEHGSKKPADKKDVFASLF